jgi:hypothetical protein
MKVTESVLVEGRPSSCWIVEFRKGVTKGRRKKLYIVDVNLEVDRLVQMVSNKHPNTNFVLYPVDGGTLTLPEDMPKGDIVYSSDSRKVNDDLEVLFEPEDDIATITFRPPAFGEENLS